ncbi:FtsX-like permease family protein [Bifidobacterium leontopitheci]|nr:FtsX-like permease family protein [Bifidobacterium leontopitheci]
MAVEGATGGASTAAGFAGVSAGDLATAGSVATDLAAAGSAGGAAAVPSSVPSSGPSSGPSAGRTSRAALPSAFVRDTLRCWLRSWKRFASIAVISMLGVAVLTGIYAGCRDAFLAAGRFYDAQGLHDIQIVSTAGLTDDDVAALRRVSGVETVEAVRSRSATLTVGGSSKTVTLQQIGDRLDRPYLQRGRLPQAAGEAAVTAKFLKDAGLKLGDMVDIADSMADDVNDAATETDANRLTIVGVVIDPRDLSNPDGYSAMTSFRSSSTEDYTFFVTETDAAATLDADSAAETTVSQSDTASSVASGDPAQSDTAAASGDTSDASTSDTDDAAPVYTAINLRVRGAADLDTFSDVYDDAVSAVTARIEQRVQSDRQKARRTQLEDAVTSRIADARSEADRKFAQAQTQIDRQRDQLNAQVDALASAMQGQTSAQPQSSTQPQSSRQAAATQAAAPSAATAATTTTAQLRAAIIAQSPQLTQAQRQLDQAQSDLDAQRAKTTRQLAEQQSQALADLPEVRWYVQTRASIGGFSAFKSDMSSIQSIGRAFPVVFLLVAVLMSLTAMTRMVEEDRGLIGTYLALGYGGLALAARYLLFALLACLIGGGLGLLAGFLGIPAFLLVVIEGLYTLPGVQLEYDWLYGSAGIALFVVGVAVATAVACRGEIRQTPAALMRPKAPKAGARILLERVGPLWRRLSFLGKVTARNIFRFKSRLIMTVGGVAGCTALIVCGFAINDTVATLGVKQYDGIYRYDLMTVSADADAAAMRARLDDDGLVTSSLNVRVENGEIGPTGGSDSGSTGSVAAGGSETIQLVVVPRGKSAQLGRMIDLRTADTGPVCRYSGGLFGCGGGTAVTLGDGGVIVSQSAANSLGIQAGDVVALRGDGLERTRVKVAAVTRSLIGSDVYVSETLYGRLFGGDGDAAPVWNAVYAKLGRSSDAKQIAYADDLADDPVIVKAVSCADLAASFAFDLMGAVVALIVALAGALALVVLFTLANTNVSERVREMATLKVLGFYDREVHRYVNREMLLLTLMGVVVGLPLGRWVGGLLTAALNMPSLYFEVDVRWSSYLIAAVATVGFSLIVQLLTNPVLDRIDPVSSLKSVE